MMKCIGDYYNETEDYSNVRICIAKYDDIDYTANYSKIIEERKRGSEISHLVALYISSRHKNIVFKNDESAKFDAIIETDLDHLVVLLTSVMVDISLYHYFMLSSDYKFRSEFNNHKFRYIFNTMSPETIRKVYGNSVVKEKPIYLPFSLQKVGEVIRRTKIESKNETIDSLIYEFAILLTECIGVAVTVDCNGYINEKIFQNGNVLAVVKNYVTSLRKGKMLDFERKILLIQSQDTTKSDALTVLEYNQAKFEIESWTSMLGNDCYDYTIVILIKEGMK